MTGMVPLALIIAVTSSLAISSSATAIPASTCSPGKQECTDMQPKVEREIEEEEESDAKLMDVTLLQAKLHKVQSIADTEEEATTCAPLVLPGFELQGCDSLAPGSSCEVACPENHVGDPVRYFCFSDLAKAGKPPAGVQAPTCFEPGVPFFSQGETTGLVLAGKGCLKCSRYAKCEFVSDYGPDDDRCTSFTVDLETNRFVASFGQCLDIYWGPAPGAWPCDNKNFPGNQKFLLSVPTDFVVSTEMCSSSSRGKVCVQKSSLRKPVSVDASASLKPAISALRSNDTSTFFQNTYAVQQCLARLQSNVPDPFWTWLQQQEAGLRRALFSTFPASPGQVQLFHDIRASVGEEKFDEQKMAPFAVGLSYVNRKKKSLSAPIQMPHPEFEINDNGYVVPEKPRVTREMEAGQHCGIQSNECRDLNKCCGNFTGWKFKWPRDPSPSVGEWAHWWVTQTATYGDKLWMNPLRDLPWNLGVYLWPSPLSECEWTQRILAGGAPMEGSWYDYDSMFHTEVCKGGAYHPDSIPGIATYGGVCGRMAQLAWRKTSCLGMPATMHSETGHCAAMKFDARTGVQTTLNVDTSELITLIWSENNKCLSCKSSWKTCEFSEPGSADCTRFDLEDVEAAAGGAKELTVPKLSNMCLDMFGGGSTPGLWRCNSSPNQKVSVADADAGTLILSPRSFGLTQVTAPDAHANSCLDCSKPYSACSFETAGSAKCTVFMYEPAKSLISAGSGMCLDTFGGSTPGVWKCNGESYKQKTTAASDGTLEINNVKFRRAGGGSVPTESQKRWSVSGIQEIHCNKENCHFPSMLSLDTSSVTEWRHKEAAVALAESLNDYETDGLWPTAFDEARLAASMAFALKKQGAVQTAELEPLVAWALQRNPSDYEAWRLAADLPGLSSADLPSRDSLPSRQWFNELSLLGLRSASDESRAAAETFARRHLLASRSEQWERYPQLYSSLVARLCPSLSDGTVAELGVNGEQCRTVRSLKAGLDWEKIQDELVYADAYGEGNTPSDKFQKHYEVIVQLVATGDHDAKLGWLVEETLEDLSVGHINVRSQTFYGQHARVLLRGPYAQMLQLAGAVLSRDRRGYWTNITRAILEDPLGNPKRMWARSDEIKNGFLGWLAQRRPRAGPRPFQKSQADDQMNGYSPGDGPNDEIVDSMRLDADKEMEFGARLWDEPVDDVDPTSNDRHEIVGVLRSLLRLNGRDRAANIGTVTVKRSPIETLRLLEVAKSQAQPSPEELLQSCVADALST